ncbi:MAG: DNA alkylation repair protein [Flavobacteriales bacterium]|nr:DNA alkylation repair protein [Flavobacteriales bacterium]MCB9198327.1 DNA alkylation repair protein [Flavobacteriales bacterium]
MVSNFISELRRSFEENSNAEIAAGQKAYMKDNFEFLGLKTETRRELAQPFMAREHLPVKDLALDIVKECWGQDEREFQQFGQDFLLKFTKKLDLKDISFLEYLVTHKSWWDTVDVIATKAVGDYMKKFPEQRKKYVEKWCNQDNMWLRRTAILFQLKYKKDTDLKLLTYAIENNLGSKEFFINKAIGWVLRDYSRVDADWVLNFVENHPALSNLSKREATRLIKD